MNAQPVLFEDLKNLLLSSMHMKIHCFELVRLFMFCFLFFTCSQIFNAACKKREMETGRSNKEAKTHFQNIFLSKEGGGLRVFIPCPSGGNSNTGVCANLYLSFYFLI